MITEDSREEVNLVPYSLALRMSVLGYDVWTPDMYFNSWGDVAASNQKYMKFGDHYNVYSDVDQTACFDAYVVQQPGSSRNDLDHFVYAPLWQEAFKWFRDNFRLYAEIHKMFGGFNISIISSEYKFDSRQEKEVEYHVPKYFEANISSHEEAQLACIEKLIEIVEK